MGKSFGFSAGKNGEFVVFSDNAASLWNRFHHSLVDRKCKGVRSLCSSCKRHF